MNKILQAGRLSLTTTLFILPITAPADLVGYWKLDGDFTDSSGNGNDGTMLGNVTYDPDAPAAIGGGQSAAFDGVPGTYGSINNGAGGIALTANPSYTISMWVKGDGTLNSDDRVFSEGQTFAANPLFNMGTHNASADGRLSTYIRNGEVYGHAYSNGSPFDNTWHHIAFVSENKVARLYIDGVFDREHDYTAIPDFTPDTTTIGGILRDTDCCNFLGSIDEVSVWDNALSEGEVNLLAVGTPADELDLDADNDGLIDGWERFYGLATDDDGSTNIDNGPDGDPDNDNSTNAEEFANRTSPINPDTDGDGIDDGNEDGGGVFVSATQTGTDPLNPDTDGDGLGDGIETNSGTFVDANDTGTDPNEADTDGDDFADGLEVLIGTSSPTDFVSRPLRNGLLDILAFWDFNDASDPDATFDRVNGIQGDLKPGTLYTAGGTGRSEEAGDRALDFGPTGQVGTGVIVEQARFLDLAGMQDEIGISMWVNVPSFQASMAFYANSTTLERALSGHAPWSNGQLYWDTAGCCNGSTQRINAPGGILENSWTHVVFNKNGDNKEIWVNGTLIISGVNTADLPTSFTRFFIGTDSNSLNTVGLIDDMAIYADALSSDEIAALAAGDDPLSIVPGNDDGDLDGMPDVWESANGLNPAVDDAGDDLDNDGVSNLDEYLGGTAPDNDDTDDDGLLDGVESNSGTFVSSTETGTDPLNPDSDGDGLLDGVESGSGSFAGASDTGTDPTRVDSDGDSFDDELEVSEGSDPTDPDDIPSIPIVTILGSGTTNEGTDALIGGDLTDPENDGVDIEGAGFDPATNNWNFVSIDANDEPDFQGGEFAYNIFDNQVGGGNAKWCCNPPSPELTVTVEFEEEISLTHFTITSGNDTPSRDPLTFFIEGSNDGETFETIYERDDDTAIWTARNQTARIDLPSPADPYRFFRYRVTRTGGPNHQINEIEYFGEPGMVGPPVITDFSYDPETAQVTLTWNSRENREYSVFASTDLLVFDQEITDGFASQGDQTTFSFQNFTPEFETLFFRVVENE